MIRGVGLDVVDIAAFRRQLSEPGSVFGPGTFTRGEWEEVDTRPSADKAPHLAARFAAKEAYLKAWSQASGATPPSLPSIDLRQIEVTSDPFGRPSLRLHGALADAARALGLTRVHLSLSHDGPFAAAVVLLE